MKKKTKQRILSFILTSSMLLTAPYFPAGAKTAEEVETTETAGTEEMFQAGETIKPGEIILSTENTQEPAQDIPAEEDVTKTGNSAEGTETEQSQTESTEESLPETSQEDSSLQEDTENLPLQEVEEELFSGSPANPVHHCTKKNDGSDYTEWSYVYFGSYPQTEVTGSELTSDIVGASYDANGDAWVDGTKYRRISKIDTNNNGFNGVYSYFGDSTYRYFKWERIKWKVLQNDGSALFVMADKGLDCKDYNEKYAAVTWEDCTLRSWLNNIFYKTAFSDVEQKAVVTQTVTNENNSEYGTEGGNNTIDKAYLLSIGEVSNPSYGFCEDSSTDSASRRVHASDYAYVMGVYYREMFMGGYTDCTWWLRSPGNVSYASAYVPMGGYISHFGSDVRDYSDAVVPALHIKLSSNLWSSADNGTSGEGGSGEKPNTDTGNATVSSLGTKELRRGKEDFLFLYIHGDKESELDAVKNTAEITVSDTSILTAEKGSLSKGIAPTSAGATDAIWTLKLKGLKPGNAKIEVKLKGNIAASCDVTVTTSTGKSPIPVDSNDPAQISKAVAFKLSDYMSDIEGENATIYGPTLDIIGKQFSLFQIDASTKIGTDNLKAEVSYDVEKKLVKVLIGVSTSGKAGIDGTTDNRMCNASWSQEYNQFKSLYKQMTGLEAKKSNGNGTYWNQFQKLKGKMNRFQCKLMVDADMWASGYMEWSYESGELKFSEGGFVEQAALKVGLKQYVPQAPLVYWFISVTADEKGNFLFHKAGDTLAADFSLTPSLAAEIGVGAGKSEGKYQTYIEASMEAILAANIANKDPKLTVNLTGNLHAKAYALGYEFVDETVPFADVQLYPGENSRAFGMRTLAIGDVNDPYKDAKLLSREYLEEPERAAVALSMAGTYMYEQNNIYPYCEPHLFALSGGRFLLLYVGDDGTKSQNNRTSLMYTLYNGSGWSEVKKLAEDGTYVDGISACQDGDKIYVTYRRAKKTFSDNAAIADKAASMDLYEAIFDGTKFGLPVCVNGEANSVMESGQVVCAENGEVTLAWIENTENDIFLGTGKNSLHMRTLKGGIWQPEITVTETGSTITEINIGKVGGTLALVYAVKNSANVSDTTVYSYVGSKASQILSGYSQPGEFRIKGGCLYFLNNDMLYSYDGKKVQQETGISGISNYQIFEAEGKQILLTNVLTASGSELYIAEKTNGSWGPFRQFTSQAGYIRNYDALWDGKTVKAAVNRLEPDAREEGTYKEASLFVTGEEEVYDITADYIYYEETAVSPGKNLPLEIGFTNRGKDTITKAKVVLTDGAGKQVASKELSINLKAGESGTAALNYELPANLADRKLSATLSLGENEPDRENNTVSTEIHYIDLAVKNAKCTMTAEKTLLVTGTIVNQGLEDITNVTAGLYYSNISGEKLDECQEDVLKAGESMEFKSVLPGDMTFSDDSVQMGGLMVYAQSDAEERNYANNEARIVYNSKGEQTNLPDSIPDIPDSGGAQGGDSSAGVVPPQQIETPPADTNPAGGSDNQETQNIKVKKISISGISKKIAAGKKISLKAAVSPKNASNSKVKWKTSSKRYATVNSKGVVTTKKAGKGKTVTITAAAADGSRVKASYKIKLMKHPVKKVKITNGKKTLKAGKTLKLKVKVTTDGKDANKTLKWSTSNKKYATVDKKGKVKAKKAGKGKTVTITAQSTDGTNKKAKVKIKIK